MARPALPHAVPTASVEEVLAAPGARIVDLRSPAEFALDHLPRAINVPLFDDAERALIGTLYARSSPEAAFDEGRRFTRGHIGALVDAIAAHAGWSPPRADLERRVLELTEGGIRRLEGQLVPGPVERLPARPLVLHCWRGGLRSRSVVAFLRELGLADAVGLEGGYRAYRRHVVARLEAWVGPPTFVLRGLTGVGKTLVLRELERLRPGWTLDLEELAAHRSSILGMVGLEPRSQKRFESLLLGRLLRGFPGPLVVEGESRKVGDVIVPRTVWRALEEGTSLELRAAPERRVHVLIEDYLARPRSRAELRRRLPFLEARLGRRWTGELVRMLDEGREEELVLVLLERYYDPLYRRSEKGRSVAGSFDASDPAAAAAALADWIEGHGEAAAAPS